MLQPGITGDGALEPPLGGEMEVIMTMNHEYCVYKASAGGIQRPLYYGSEEDCRRFCEQRNYEYIDEQQVAWYLEVARNKNAEVLAS